jgi:lipopolysaccharide export system permease protein
MRSLIYDIQQQRPEIQIKEGAFYNGIENYSIKIGRRDQKSNLLHDIIIYDHSAGMGNISVTIADSGYIKITADKQTLMVILFNGESYNEITNDTYNSKSKNNPLRRDKFSKQVINIELTGFDLERTNEELFKGSYQMMNISQLKKMIDSMRLNIEVDRVDLKNNLNSLSYTLKTNVGIEKDSIKKDSLNLLKQKLNFTTLYNSLSSTEKLSAINIGISSAQNAKSMLSSEISIRKSKIKRMMKHEIELHRKFTLSVACIVFFLIGAPLGAIIRKGGLGMPLVISVFFFVLYYVITLMGEKFVRETILTPFEGVWISTFILLPLGAFLTYKATSDAALMNIESYMQAINKVVNLRFIFLRKKQKT